MTWIQTYSGRAVDLLNPKPDQIDLGDIAHALARICRYTGHVKKHYSVAQHSVLCSYEADLFERETLMHDASEAYIQDLSKPLKMAMEILNEGVHPYQAIEEELQYAIRSRFDLDRFDFPRIKAIDHKMLATEVRDLGFLDKAPRPWRLGCTPYKKTIKVWSAEYAEQRFLSAARKLGIK